MMPSRPRLILSVLVALAIALGVVLLIAPHDTGNKLTHSLAQPEGHQNQQ